MDNSHILIKRIKNFCNDLHKQKFFLKKALTASYIYNENGHIPYIDALTLQYNPIHVGERWGKNRGCGWFKLSTQLDNRYKGYEIAAVIDLGEKELFIWTVLHLMALLVKTGLHTTTSLL